MTLMCVWSSTLAWINETRFSKSCLDHRELVVAIGTRVIQRGKISGVGIDFTGDLNNLDIVTGGVPAHDGQSPGA